jgi:uncharacterized membrane protein
MVKKEVEKNIADLIVPKSRALTFGQRAADKITILVGSWQFIFGVVVFIIIWVGLNIYAWIENWDPYPFILLNLILSCMSAIQTPLILMSQNREEHKDRLRMEYDYKINKKAEKEIREIKNLLIKYHEKQGLR